jgi:acyl-CoA thioesterase FadM
MPRVRLKPLQVYPFLTRIAVRTTDLNYGGHLGWDRLLTLAHEARIAFLGHLELSELDCHGVSLILGDVAAVYQSEAFAGDELCFELSAGEFSSSGFRIFYRVTRAEDSAPVALIETGMACFSYRERRICRLPDSLRELLATRD